MIAIKYISAKNLMHVHVLYSALNAFGSNPIFVTGVYSLYIFMQYVLFTSCFYHVISFSAQPTAPPAAVDLQPPPYSEVFSPPQQTTVRKTTNPFKTQSHFSMQIHNLPIAVVMFIVLNGCCFVFVSNYVL